MAELKGAILPRLSTIWLDAYDLVYPKIALLLPDDFVQTAEPLSEGPSPIDAAPSLPLPSTTPFPTAPLPTTPLASSKAKTRPKPIPKGKGKAVKKAGPSLREPSEEISKDDIIGKCHEQFWIWRIIPRLV